MRCPQCKSQTKLVIRQLIDAQDLVMKSAFLQKRVHRVHCPQCNATLIAAVPSLYFDTEKQFALIYVPSDLHVALPTQAATSADLIAMLRAHLPPEQHSEALLNPRPLTSLDAMVKAVLAADGLDLAQIKVQTARAALIETLLQSPSEAALRETAAVHAAELDAAFFEVLTAYMQAAHFRGDAGGAQTFLALRTLMGQLAPDGNGIIAAIDAKLGLRAIQSREDLLEGLRRASSPKERAALVASGQMLLDESFFQLLNQAISEAQSAGDTATARQLQQLNTTIAELKAAEASKSQAALARAAALFQAVVQADAPDELLKERIADVDESFFVVLGANIERARRQGQQEPARALELIGQLARALQQA
jgi:hypothetical protein